MNNEIKNIADLPSYSKTLNEMKSFDKIRKIIKFFSVFGIGKKLDKKFQELPTLIKQAEHLASIPDRFNKYFSKLGWIAHETMNFTLMENSVFLADNGKIKKAESNLADHFTSIEIQFMLHQFKLLPEFKIRYSLFERVYKDTLERRFYSCIPVQLLLIDGVVNDISKSKGFFSKNTEFSAWDCVASHSSGLSVIRDVFNQTRKKTNSNEIFIPYRNGILHGRDINYANKYVAGKNWCTLVAIKDWGRALKKELENPQKKEQELTIRQAFSELKRSLIEHQTWKVEHEKVMKLLDNWKARNVNNNTLKTLEFKENTPEKEAYNFGLNWRNKKYGNIVKQFYNYGEKININHEAGKIRKLLVDKELLEFEILKIDDKAPSISEVKMKFVYKFDKELKEKEIDLRMQCTTENDGIGINGQKNVIWKIIDNFFFYVFDT